MDDNTPNESTLNGAEIIVKCLERAGTSVVFAYPGASSMLLHQALLKSRLSVVLPRHEQGGCFEACGYARASGKTGVCIATSGPGATNLVTAITDAWMDSVPLIAITAQVNHRLIGKNAFQETDIIGMTRPVVKHSYLVMSAEEIPEIMEDAFALAGKGRPGPVVIDVPCDILAASCIPAYPGAPGLRALNLTSELRKEDLLPLRRALSASSRPCIFAGGGVIVSDACTELLQFAEQCRIPVATSLMGLGSFPGRHPLSLNLLGMHGTYHANKAVSECDLLIGLGVRFSDRVASNPNDFAPGAKIVHVDIDNSEINKNKHSDIAITADLKELLAALLESPLRCKSHAAWLKQIDQWRQVHPEIRNGSGISGPSVITALDRLTASDAVIVTGVGQNQMWAAQYYSYSRPRQLLTSGGLGAMGFGLPAAIGAKIAKPGEQIILVDGDGSFQMNIQELATAFAENTAVKIVILNNQRLGMVAQLEDKFYGGRHANTDLTIPRAGRPYPDFCTIAKGYMIPAKEVWTPEELEPALAEMLATDTPFLLDIHIEPDEMVLPMIPAGKACGDIILE